MTDFQKKYFSALKSQYPRCISAISSHSQIEYLISDACIEIPIAVYNRAYEAIKSLYIYAHTTAFLNHLIASASEEEKIFLKHNPPNSSVLMAYDFHVNMDDHTLSLIEINTNASAFLLSELLYQVKPVQVPWENSLDLLTKSFRKELSYLKNHNSIALIDENISKQKMYIEFLMYLDFFQRMEVHAEIFEFNKIPLDKFSFIYNRHTDFLLSSIESTILKKAYLENKVILSPHPKEYLLMALKDRLIDFYNNKISDVLIPIFELKTPESREYAWQKRKTLFFKPRASFGSKAAYRGSSVSRSTFEKNVNENFIAQEYRPPELWNDFKFDLRFYVYEDIIQLVVARTYQGQVTNFASIGGGLARVHFTN